MAVGQCFFGSAGWAGPSALLTIIRSLESLVSKEIAHPFFFAQIESLRLIEHVAEIAALDGVDGLFVGPADLAHDLSVQGNGHAPPFEECLTRVVAAARAADKPAGILVCNLADLPHLCAVGFTPIAIDSDVAILRQRRQRLLGLAREPAAALPTGRDARRG